MLAVSVASAGSTTLTTYYPAPTGNYDKLTANNIGIGQSTTTAARLDILAGGDDDNPVIRMRQSNASTYGIDLGIDNNVNGGLVFRTVNNGTSAVAMTLDRGTGYLGIGVTSPSAKLAVAAAAGNGLYVGNGTFNNPEGWNQVIDLQGSGHARLEVRTGLANMGMYSHDTWQAVSGVTPGGFIGTYNNYPVSILVNTTQRMVFDTSGNVGIGMANPQAKLSVAGYGTGYALLGGDCGGNYTALSLNTAALGGCVNYNMLSSPSDQNLYINRPSGYNMYFRESNGTQLTIASGGDISASGTISTSGSRPGNWMGIFNNTGGPYGLTTSNSSGYYAQLANGITGLTTNGIISNSAALPGNWIANFTSTTGPYGVLSNIPNNGYSFYGNGGMIQIQNGWGGNWAGIFNSTAGPYGITTSNSSGYYAQLANSQYGMNTNGTIRTDNAWTGNWAGIFINNAGTYGIYSNGMIQSNSSWGANWAGYFANAAGVYGFMSTNTTGYYTQMYSSWGLITNGNVGTASFQCVSDQRLKKNVHPITNALDKVQRLNGVTFNWKKNGVKSLGLIAQDVEKVVPELVGTGPEGMKTIQYGNLVGLLVEAIKEQQKEIDELKKKVGGGK